jgi:hypothetical protein
MKRVATSCLVLAALLVASSALAVDLHRKHQAIPISGPLFSVTQVNVVLGCDDNVASSAYYQATDDRLGNLFSFGSGAVLSHVGFWHYGYGFAGPYSYDVEVWDPVSCTYVTGKNGLSATDAANAAAFDVADLCGDNIYLTGDLAVTIDPNTCAAPNDCYPDLLFDDQLNVFCPIIINNASTAPACYDVSAYNGPFLLRIDTNNCPTPAKTRSWGDLKSIYR